MNTSIRPPMLSGGLPLLGHLRELAAHPEALVWRGHREQGLVYRIKPGPAEAVVALGNANCELFFHDRNLSTEAAYPFFRTMFAPDFFSLADDAAYREQKNIILPRFSGRQHEGYAAVMTGETAKFAERLGATGEFELAEEFGRLVMNIAARAFLGDRFATEIGGDFFGRFRWFSKQMTFAPRFVPTAGRILGARAGRSLKADLTEMLVVRRRTPLPEPDFLQTLAGATYSDGTPVPDDVLVNLVLLLVWAGHESTTGHLSWALLDLLRHPEVLARARVEADAVLGAGPIDLDGVSRLRVIDACVHETERRYPIAPVLIRNAVADMEIGGYAVPAGTQVFTSPAVNHRLPEEHSDPDGYRPDRYLGADAKQERAKLMGFGGGLHKCLGTRFAKLEMTIILAELLRRYDLELTTGTPRPDLRAKSRWPAAPCTIAYRVRRPASV
ncbi:cytochrome P450 [Nocardia yamanashiensis]|uniref:cytochrome P450 n=1 Tax=Nocardia yamanashiensis TaxID=209247 RepID=UPI001E55B90A|nr:cytochrome P450 [Nocardia yamanashiensis]UGT41610.1 cytochrome P450 [Nocardia yamanashiensis]